MYFHTDEPEMVDWLANVFSLAAANGRRVRLETDSKGQLRIKIGEGAWTVPLRGTVDPYRDHSVVPLPVCNHNCEAGPRHPDEAHYLDCPVWLPVKRSV